MNKCIKTTMAIALIALAASAATQTAQAQGELEYAENLFAIVWFERKPADQKPIHRLKILHWTKTASVFVSNFIGNSPTSSNPITGRTANGFNRNKEYVTRITDGTIQLSTREIGNALDDSVVFYIQVDTSTKTFFPERALKVEVFHNRRIAVITHQDTGFRRLVPVQRYATNAGDWNHEKEPRTAINFGPLK